MTAKALDQGGWNLLTRKGGRKSYSPRPRSTSEVDDRPAKKRKLSQDQPLDVKTEASEETKLNHVPDQSALPTPVDDAEDSTRQIFHGSDRRRSSFSARKAANLKTISPNDKLRSTMHDYPDYDDAKELAIWVAWKIDDARKSRSEDSPIVRPSSAGGGNAKSTPKSLTSSRVSINSHRRASQGETPEHDRVSSREYRQTQAALSRRTMPTKPHTVTIDSTQFPLASSEALSSHLHTSDGSAPSKILLGKVLAALGSESTTLESQESAKMLQTYLENGDQLASIVDSVVQLAEDPEVLRYVDEICRLLEDPTLYQGGDATKRTANAKPSQQKARGRPINRRTSATFPSPEEIPVAVDENHTTHKPAMASNKKHRVSSRKARASLYEEALDEKETAIRSKPEKEVDAANPPLQLSTPVRTPAESENNILTKQDTASSGQSSTIIVGQNHEQTPLSVEPASDSSFFTNASPGDFPSSITSFESKIGTSPPQPIPVIRTPRRQRLPKDDAPKSQPVDRPSVLKLSVPSLKLTPMNQDQEAETTKFRSKEDSFSRSPQQSQSGAPFEDDNLADAEKSRRLSKRVRKPTERLLEAVEVDRSIKSPVRTDRPPEDAPAGSYMITLKVKWPMSHDDVRASSRRGRTTDSSALPMPDAAPFPDALEKTRRTFHQQGKSDAKAQSSSTPHISAGVTPEDRPILNDRNGDTAKKSGVLSGATKRGQRVLPNPPSDNENASKNGQIRSPGPKSSQVQRIIPDPPSDDELNVAPKNEEMRMSTRRSAKRRQAAANVDTEAEPNPSPSTTTKRRILPPSPEPRPPRSSRASKRKSDVANLDGAGDSSPSGRHIQKKQKKSGKPPARRSNLSTTLLVDDASDVLASNSVKADSIAANQGHSEAYNALPTDEQKLVDYLLDLVADIANASPDEDEESDVEAEEEKAEPKWMDN